MPPFDMPDGSHSFEERGGWVARQLMRDYSLTANQAGGIVGNLGFESMGLKHLQEIKPAVEGSAGGYGWAQWTGPRRRAYFKFIHELHEDPASDEANYSYLKVDLNGDYAYCLNALRLRNRLEDCVFIFGRLYEAPGGTTATHLPGFTGRLDYARRALSGVVVQPTQPAQPAQLAPVLTPEPVPAPQKKPWWLELLARARGG